MMAHFLILFQGFRRWFGHPPSRRLWRRCLKCQQGFLLIELAVVLVVIGLVAGVAFSDLKLATQQRRQKVTRLHQQRLREALISHLAHYGCLPAPAADSGPFQGQAGSAGGQFPSQGFGQGASQLAGPLVSPRAQAFKPSLNAGIVPFRTLGLDSSVAKDGYNRFFTYAVHGPLTIEGLVDKTSLCRAGLTSAPTLEVQDGARGPVSNMLAKAPMVAAMGTSVAVSGSMSGPGQKSLAPGWSPPLAGPEDPGDGGAGSPLFLQDLPPGSNLPPTATLAASSSAPIRSPARPTGLRREPIGVVLVSHGPSGQGAPDGRGGRKALSSKASQGKRQNASGTGSFVARPTPNDGGLFDDLVIFWTTSQLFAGAGISCYDVLYPPVATATATTVGASSVPTSALFGPLSTPVPPSRSGFGSPDSSGSQAGPKGGAFWPRASRLVPLSGGATVVP